MQGDQKAFQMPQWREIPDLGLYMDQVVLYVQRAYEALYGLEETKRLLTPAMVNNYVKAGLIPRPTGKKYGREQLAAILMIVQLKGVLSMEMIRLMLADDQIEALYGMFCEKQYSAMRAFDIDDPLTAATEACIHALACERLLLARRNKKENSVGNDADSMEERRKK